MSAFKATPEIIVARVAALRAALDAKLPITNLVVDIHTALKSNPDLLNNLSGADKGILTRGIEVIQAREILQGKVAPKLKNNSVDMI